MKHQSLILVILLLIFTSNLASAKKTVYPLYTSTFEYTPECELAAKKGDDMAMLLTGLHYLPRTGGYLLVKLPHFQNRSSIPDEKKAIDFIKKSANKGNPIAMIVYGQILGNRNIMKPDLKVANQWASKAVKTGYPDAYAFLAYSRNSITEFGKSQYSLSKIIINDLQQGVDNGSALCASILGDIYSTGQIPNVNLRANFPQDFLKAVEYYKKALGQGLPSSYLANLPKFYWSGTGVTKDINKSLYYNAIINNYMCSDTDLRQYYNQGAFGANPNISYETWKNKLKENCEAYQNNNEIFDMPIITLLSKDIYKKEINGACFLSDNNGNNLYPHYFDQITCNGDTIKAVCYKYTMEILNDGSIIKTIGEQMLDNLSECKTIIEGIKCMTEIMSYDPDGSEGISPYACTNYGCFIESQYKPFVATKKMSKKEKLIAEYNDEITRGQINTSALICYERALEIEPSLTFAAINAERLRDNIKDKPKVSAWDYANIFVDGLAQNASFFNLSTTNQPHSGSTHSNSTVSKPKKNNHSGAGRANNDVGEERLYYKMESRLSEMKNGSIPYDDSERKTTQNKMRSIREHQLKVGGFKITKSPLEDWNGK